jgi:predicted GNAT family N-acyltransferase
LNRQDYSIGLVRWQDTSDELSAIRRQVFIDEQEVPPELEWDGRDDAALHVIARSMEGEAIGTARLLPEGQIGRMAVLQPWRKRGIGSGLLRCLIAHAGEKERLFLNAQTSAENFYRHNGFKAEGAVFMEAGIPHIRMRYRPSR